MNSVSDQWTDGEILDGKHLLSVSDIHITSKFNKNGITNDNGLDSPCIDVTFTIDGCSNSFIVKIPAQGLDIGYLAQSFSSDIRPGFAQIIYS
jgi:hypothetical protein